MPALPVRPVRLSALYQAVGAAGDDGLRLRQSLSIFLPDADIRKRIVRDRSGNAAEPRVRPRSRGY